MWFFGSKDKKAKKGDAAATPNKPLTLKEQKAKELLAIMKTARAEIGEENLQELVRKIKLDDLKKQIREDIDTNPHKRERLLDAIRYEMYDNSGKPPTRH